MSRVVVFDEAGVLTPWGLLRPGQFPEGARLVDQALVPDHNGVMVTKYDQIWGQAFTFDPDPSA